MLLAALAAAALVTAGCGGGESAGTIEPPTTTSRPVDPGGDAIRAFVAAARAGNAQAMWRMLSTETRDRLGPGLRAFRKTTARELAEGVGSFGRYRVIVSERITPELGVVAIDGFRTVEGTKERDVYAAVLRLERSTWRLELRGPVRVRAIGPRPGARERVVAQIAAAVEGHGGSGTAVMYLDGQAVNPKVAGTASDSTLFANLDPALSRGRHTVVVFASTGREASALAWAFTVTGT